MKGLTGDAGGYPGRNSVKSDTLRRLGPKEVFKVSNAVLRRQWTDSRSFFQKGKIIPRDTHPSFFPQRPVDPEAVGLDHLGGAKESRNSLAYP